MNSEMAYSMIECCIQVLLGGGPHQNFQGPIINTDRALP